MSLLDDVSIVVTPNGYKAGELYAVIPVPTFGADEVLNGDFATDLSDWNITGTDATHTVTWTASGARFQSDTTSPVMEFKQLNLLTSSKRYVLTCDITYTGSGTLKVNVGSNLPPLVEGSNTVYFTATSTTLSILRFNANVDAIIDNVIVKEYTSADMDVTRATAATRVDENGLVNYAEVIGGEEVTCGDFSCAVPTDYWTENGWTINGEASNDGVNTGNLNQDIGLQQDKTYLVEVTITNYNSGTLQVRLGLGATIDVGSSEDTFSLTLTSTSTNSLLRFYPKVGSLFNGSISNVSVKEVTRDNVPRIDYTGGGCPHILAEPQRTNLVTYSSDFTDSSWTNVGVTVTPNNATSPDGTLNASSIELTSGDYMYFTHNTTINVGDTYTWSCFVKSSSLKISWGGGTPDGTDINTVEALSNGWYRQVLRRTFTTTGTGMQTMFAEAVAGAGLLDVWGAQLEEGSYATSYIPNFGTALGVTRNQDIFTRDGIGSLINSTEGVLFVEMAALSDDLTDRRISLNDGSNANEIIIGYSRFTGNIIGEVFSGGSIQNSNWAANGVTQTNNNKFALSWGGGTMKFYLNGLQTNIETGVTSPVGLNTLELSIGNDTLNMFAKVKQLQVYDTALTDEQLLQLTGESGTDFYESYAEMASALTYTIQ